MRADASAALPARAALTKLAAMRAADARDAPHGGASGAIAGDDVLVSVLVPVRNEAPTLAETVAAMQRQRAPGPVEFLFMDGHSSDATRAILEALRDTDARIRILDNPSGGIAPALNIGLHAARGQFIARMDAHTIYPHDYLRLGVERLRARDVDWVSGPQLPHGTEAGSRRAALALRSPLGIGGSRFRRPIDEELETDSAFTGMWRRDTLERLGGWNEEWVVNEDGELAARLRQAGGRIVCVPEMAAAYRPRRTLRALARQYWRYGHYRAKTSRRHPESMRRSHLLPPAVALAAALAVAPGAGGRYARLGLCVYATALAAEAARLSPSAATPLDAALLPTTLATMHLAWGSGFLAGSARFGPPVRAIGLAAVGRM